MTINTILRILQDNPHELVSWCVTGRAIHDHPNMFRGKVRICIDQKSDLLMIHSDHLSAFDRHVGNAPFKGQLLAEINEYWLQYLRSRDIAVARFSKPGPRLIRMQKLLPIPIEVVVRGRICGSLWRAYQGGERTYCGVTLPDGLSLYDSFPTPLITPTTKSSGPGHDLPTTVGDLMASGVVSEREWQVISATAQKVFDHGYRHYQERGLILADTKYEFGRDPHSGAILLMDEVHTPDSSRIWRWQDGVPKMLDKEFFRQILLREGFSGDGGLPPIKSSDLVELSSRYLEVHQSLLGPRELMAQKPEEFLKVLADHI